MTRRFLNWWYGEKWRPIDPQLAQAYQVTFSTLHGQRVLQHLLDSIYCRTYEGQDVQGAVIHNARRTVIQEILENIDAAEAPQKHNIIVETGEDVNHG